MYQVYGDEQTNCPGNLNQGQADCPCPYLKAHGGTHCHENLNQRPTNCTYLKAHGESFSPGNLNPRQNDCPYLQTMEECNDIRAKLACVQDPCCRTCPPFEEHKLPAAGIPTGEGETVAEALNWKKPVCVNPCDSMPPECLNYPLPPRHPRLQIVAPRRDDVIPLRRDDAFLGYKGGAQTMASVVYVPVVQHPVLKPVPQQPLRSSLVACQQVPRPVPVIKISQLVPAVPKKDTFDACVSKTAGRCENDCPECPIEIHHRTVYPKCEAMVPGYGGHVPGITVCKFGKTFGRETREALQKVYSTPRLTKDRKKC